MGGRLTDVALSRLFEVFLFVPLVVSLFQLVKIDNGCRKCLVLPSTSTRKHRKKPSSHCMLRRLSRTALIDSRSFPLYCIRRFYFTKKTLSLSLSLSKKQMTDAKKQMTDVSSSNSLQPVVQAQQITTQEQHKLEEDFSEVRAKGNPSTFHSRSKWLFRLPFFPLLNGDLTTLPYG